MSDKKLNVGIIGIGVKVIEVLDAIYNAAGEIK